MIGFNPNQIREKRRKWDIIRDMLKIVNNSRSTKTGILQKACIDWRSYQKYFKLILDKGFVSRDSNFSKYYVITEKGKKFLELFESIEIMISEDKKEEIK